MNMILPQLNLLPMSSFCYGPDRRSICQYWARICCMRSSETLKAAHKAFKNLRNKCKKTCKK